MQPFVPDFWESSRVKAESDPPEAEGPTSPSFIAVAGDTTHISVSPTYTDFAEPDPVEVPVSSPPNQTFLQDVTEDLFFTTSFKFPKVRQPKPVAEDVAQITTSAGLQHTDYSRTLDGDEQRGVWIFLGLLTGSWIVSGLLKPASALADESEVILEEGLEGVNQKH